MTPEQAAQLRAPFPPEAIGKIPKGGAKLDYVGHAATTDRLLSVDPEWTWEPPSADELRCLPTADGMWIKLTIAGVTRFGFGDGNSTKEWIGDAIRNAAMRFGVALDLWSKEDLQSLHDENAEGRAPADAPRAGAAGSTPGPAPSASSPAITRSSEAGSDPVRLASEPASPNKLQHLQAQLSSMQAAGFKVSGHRTKAGLPPLNDQCSDGELDAWEALLNAHDMKVRV